MKYLLRYCYYCGDPIEGSEHIVDDDVVVFCDTGCASANYLGGY